MTFPLYDSSESGNFVITLMVHQLLEIIFFLIFPFSYYHCVDTSAGGLVVPKVIIRPVVSVSTLKWFITYIYYCNLQ